MRPKRKALKPPHLPQSPEPRDQGAFPGQRLQRLAHQAREKSAPRDPCVERRSSVKTAPSSPSRRAPCRLPSVCQTKCLPLRPRLQNKHKANELLPHALGGPGSATSVRGPGQVSLSTSPIRAHSQILITWGSRGHRPCWFSTLDVLEACLSGVGLKFCVCHMWGSNPLLLREKLGF